MNRFQLFVLSAVFCSAIGCGPAEPAKVIEKEIFKVPLAAEKDRTPVGPNPKVGAIDAAAKLSPEQLSKKIGVRLYPGATVSPTEAPRKDEMGALRYELLQTTSDPIDKVAAELEKNAGMSQMLMGGKASVMGKTPSGHDLIFYLEPSNGKTLITLRAIVYDKPK